MRKAFIIIALVTTTLAARPAEACRNGHPCPLIIDVFGYAFMGAVIGGYSYGTGYFAYHDVTDDTQTLPYAAGELAYNGLFGTLWTYGAIESAKDGDVGMTVV